MHGSLGGGGSSSMRATLLGCHRQFNSFSLPWLEALLYCVAMHLCLLQVRKLPGCMQLLSMGSDVLGKQGAVNQGIALINKNPSSSLQDLKPLAWYHVSGLGHASPQNCLQISCMSHFTFSNKRAIRQLNLRSNFSVHLLCKAFVKALFIYISTIHMCLLLW